VQAVLQVQCQHEERGHPAVEDQHDDHAERRGAVAEHREPDQRFAARPFAPPLVNDEENQQRERGHHQRESPCGPPQFAPLHQRVEQGHQRRPEHQHPRHVGAAATPPARGHHQRGPHRCRHRDRDVDEEDGAPVPVRQQSAEQRAGQTADRERHAEVAHRPAPLGLRELGVDERQHLRHHQAREDTLHDPRRQQHRDVRRETGQE
jgi:hypothetical protein